MIYRGENFFIIGDKFPVSPGHLLIISNEEKLDYFTLNYNEHQELTELIVIAKKIIEKQYRPQGYNIGMNCGEVARSDGNAFSLSCDTEVQRRYEGSPGRDKTHCRGQRILLIQGSASS